MKKKSIVVIGPTASGKSDLAIQLAKKYNGEVISADSRQIHRHLDIGTGKEPGKVTFSTQRGKYTQKAYMIDRVPHYMIDIVHPNTEYNVAKFSARAKKIAADIASRKKLSIICGGTIFWAQSLIEETSFPSVLPNQKLRKKISKKSKEDLLTILKKIDPEYAGIVDKDNPIRLIRAIEIVTELGKMPKPQKSIIDPGKTLILAISHPKDVLHERIEKRMDTWFTNGIFDEIEKAHFEYHVPWSRLENFGLEYKWCTRYVRGQITQSEMRENTIRDLKRYAKRQITWIRRWEKQGAPIYQFTKKREALLLCKKFLK